MNLFEDLGKAMKPEVRKPRPVNKKSIRQATIAVLNSYPHGKKFSSGNEMTRTGLNYEVAMYLWDNFGLNKFPHIDTCLRYLREENNPVTKYACVNSGKSLYEVIR